MSFASASWLRLLASLLGRARAHRKTASRIRAFRPTLETLEDRCVPTTFLVTNTLDSGAGSFRQAITDADNNPATTGQNLIQFAISKTQADGTPEPGYRAATDSFVVRPLTPLPGVINTVIDGYSQAGAAWNTFKGVGPLGVAPGDPSQYGDDAVLKIELSGELMPTSSGQDSTGLVIDQGSTVQGLAVNRWGVQIEDEGGVVQGNFLGTDITGTTTFPHAYGDWTTQRNGVFTQSEGGLVGGTTPQARNVIAGMWQAEVLDTHYYGSNVVPFTVEGNFLGTDRGGTRTYDPSGVSFGSDSSGVFDFYSATMNIRDNLISNNTYQINLGGENASPSAVLAEGNFMGADVTGQTALGGNTGIYVRQETPDEGVSLVGNLISGMYNPVVSNATIQFQGNYVGTNVSGTATIHNVYALWLAADNNIIGGSGNQGNVFADGISVGFNGGFASSSGNLIQGNHFVGVSSYAISLTPTSSGNLVRDNDITGFGWGVIVQGPGNTIIHNSVYGNENSGIDLRAGSGNLVEDNTIYANGAYGVEVESGAGDSILGNSIHDNGALGIYLAPGANNNQAAPVLTAAYSGPGFTIVTGTITSTPNSTVHVEFFANAAGDPEGRTLLDSRPVLTDSAGHGSFTVVLSVQLPAGQGLVTATATDPNGNTSEFSAGVIATPLPPSSLSGVVWEDFNNDGQVDFGEKGISGVTITLTGTDFLGNAVNLSQLTDSDGAYVLLNLLPGNYYLTETQPAGYLQGIDSVGTAGGSLAATDRFFVQLGQGVDGLNYNYGEQPPPGGSIQRGQTAGIGFWQNKNGQNLILALNGGSTSTQLAHWLAATLPNMYGAQASAHNLVHQNGSYFSNAEVAAFFQGLFKQKGPKLDAQVLATALSVYVTNATLDPTQAAVAYGFKVSGDGVGTATVTVGSNGAAFGVVNRSALTVMDLLLATNKQAVNGLLYNGDSALREGAIDVFSDVNEDGDIR